MATQPNAVLTVSSATCEDVLGVLSHLTRLLSQPFGSEPVSNLCGQQQWLKSVEVDVKGFKVSSGDIFVANLWNACGARQFSAPERSYFGIRSIVHSDNITMQASAFISTLTVRRQVCSFKDVVVGHLLPLDV